MDNWADDPMFKRHDATIGSTSIQSPTSSQAYDAPPTTPSRKRSSQSSFDSPELTPSQKRMKLIEEALRTPSKASRSHEKLSNSIPSSTPRSQARLQAIQLGLTPKKDSNLSTQPNHVISTSTLGRPSPTPIVTISHVISGGRALQPLAANDSNKQSDVEEDAELWDRVTPPPPVSYDVDELGTHPVGTVVSRKASRETVAEPSRLNWRDDDLENPFGQYDTFSQVSNSTTKSNPYVSAPSHGDTPSKQTSESMSSIIRSPDNIPQYVEKLERRLLASEKSNTAKAKRIFELEVTIERLQEENEVLRGSSGLSLLLMH
ncbi:hypothetical protein DXG01_013615 [Tephrocybe rancida]|nr:hypothetical protein DXG01_013615 [Tephrocybe rancida]